jgi:hypothetical protein
MAFTSAQKGTLNELVKKTGTYTAADVNGYGQDVVEVAKHLKAIKQSLDKVKAAGLSQGDIDNLLKNIK